MNTNMTNNSKQEYYVEIIRASHELTKREQLKIKDLSGAVKIHAVVNPDKSLVITPAVWAVIHTHNERAKEGNNVDYESIVILDADGNKYFSGSASLAESFIEVWNTMTEGTDPANPEPFEVEFFKVESNNRAGQYFLKCGIV